MTAAPAPPPAPPSSLFRAQAQPDLAKERASIVICHSLPTNWVGAAWAGEPCPPDARQHGYVYLVGRTMFETDRLPEGFVPRCNAMNEVWVPSEFSRGVFAASGVDPRKLRVVPEGVNTTFFDPERYRPARLPVGDIVFGSPKDRSAGARLHACARVLWGDGA